MQPHLLRVVFSAVVDAVAFAGDGAIYPLGNSSRHSRGCTWLLLNLVPKTSSLVNPGSAEAACPTEAATKVNTVLAQYPGELRRQECPMCW